jgi:serine/threonine protein kinase
MLSGVAFKTDAGVPDGADEAFPTKAEIAAAFPQLEIIEIIGKGGMGVVFKARQPALDRVVALKILPQSIAVNPAFAERFAREGRLLARLNHPNIVTIHDFGQSNGYFYLLMEFVDGVNLREALRAGSVTLQETFTIVPKICEALQYAHGEGVLHRDIKPENILLGGKGRVKIADYGIARLAGEPHLAEALTAVGARIGTPHYMAPEQFERPTEVDHRADIYSLGVVFYEMLTGELPLGRFAPPSEKSGVDRRLDEVILRSLDRVPGRRPQSALEIKTQVDEISRRLPESELPPATPDRTARASVGKIVVFGLLTGAILLASAIMFFKPTPVESATGAGRTPNVVSAILPSVNLASDVNHARQDTGRAISEKSVTVARTAAVRNPVDLAPQPGVPNGANGISISFALKDVANVGRKISATNDSPLPAGSTLLAYQRLGGQPAEEASSSTTREIRRGKVTFKHTFAWDLPAAFGTVPLKHAAFAQVKDTAKRPMLAVPGAWLAVFTITNESGAVVEGLLKFERPTAVAQSEDVKGTLQVKSIGEPGSRLTLMYKSSDVPPGCDLTATVGGSLAGTGRVQTSTRRTKGTSLGHFMWELPVGFETQQQMSAWQQMSKLAPESAIAVPLGKPLTVFTVTNASGETYWGMLELSSSDRP